MIQENSQQTMRFEEVSATHWDWVHRLIADVQQQERGEHLVTLWAQWRLAVRQFRMVEFFMMRERKPAPVDYQFHRACLSGLISIGEFLLLNLGTAGSAEDLKRLGFSGEDAAAALGALRLNWDEWHCEANADRTNQLQSLIFS